MCAYWVFVGDLKFYNWLGTTTITSPSIYPSNIALPMQTTLSGQVVDLSEYGFVRVRLIKYLTNLSIFTAMGIFQYQVSQPINIEDLTVNFWVHPSGDSCENLKSFLTFFKSLQKS